MIERIKIKNFKKFTGDTFCEFVFSQGLNVIIGENNSGKTTLLNIIKAFFDNDGKYFKSLADSNLLDEAKPIIEIQNDGEVYQLVTSGKTWKFNLQKEKTFSYGFISANGTIKEIEDSFANAFIANLKGNTPLIELLNNAKKQFNSEVRIAKTEIIKEEGDSYELSINEDLKKAFSIYFDQNNPLSIANKGLGQQKEFLINYFIDKNSYKQTDTLIIDEVENSLSINSIEKICLKIKQNHQNKQFFFSTHNQSTVGDGNNVNIISIGLIPIKIVQYVQNLILCEGPNDQECLNHFYGSNNTIIHSGGSQIVKQAQNLYASGKSFKVLVDGDVDGSNYIKDIKKISASIPTHKLADGCMEDYYLQAHIDAAYNYVGSTSPSPKHVDILHSEPLISLDKAIRGNFKSFLNKVPSLQNYDETKIRGELDTFLN